MIVIVEFLVDDSTSYVLLWRFVVSWLQDMFTPFIIYPSFFYKKVMIMLLDVDNMIVGSKRKKEIDSLIKSLRKEDKIFLVIAA